MVLGKRSTTSSNEGISHLIGITSFVLCTSWKGVDPMEVLDDVQYAQSAKNNGKHKLNLCFPIILWIMDFRNRFNLAISVGVIW